MSSHFTVNTVLFEFFVMSGFDVALGMRYRGNGVTGGIVSPLIANFYGLFLFNQFIFLFYDCL